jgi:outer membrane receptor protein involved in Fe transport
MSMQERLLVVATFAIAAASGLAENPPVAATTAAGLSGRWHLNTALSDDARAKMEQARAEHGGGRRGGGGMGGGGMGGGGMGGGGRRWGGGGRGRPQGESEDGASGGDRRPGLQGLFEPAPELTITDTAAEITVFEKDGVIRVLQADGEKHKTDNGLGDVKTHRDKDKVIVETQTQRGGKITEVFALSADHKQLTSDIRLQGRFGDVNVHRVYDALPAE